MTLLEVEDLQTQYETENGSLHAVDGVGFSLDANETLGLVGESGSGKTTIAKSILRLLPDNGQIVDGSINYRGRDVNKLSNREFRRQIRWKELAYIPQNAMNGFDPVYTVGEQFIEVIRTHEPDRSRRNALARARELFEHLGIEANRVNDYPHQFSGGMAQRAMIALALALEPAVIIADEPTTALDVVIQDRILRTIKEIQEELDSAMILITHDVSVVSETCDRIAVMYGGRIAEQADARTIIKNPRHPYTLGLGKSFPSITADNQELISIPGTPPNLLTPDESCRFSSRCPFAEEECRTVTPAPEAVRPDHVVECHRVDEYEYLQSEATEKDTWSEGGSMRPRGVMDD